MQMVCVQTKIAEMVFAVYFINRFHFEIKTFFIGNLLCLVQVFRVGVLRPQVVRRAVGVLPQVAHVRARTKILNHLRKDHQVIVVAGTTAHTLRILSPITRVRL